MLGFADRFTGALKLDARIYREVARDPQGLPQAVGVVVLASVGAGLGVAGAGQIALVSGIIGALISWTAWALMVHVIGARMLPGPETRPDIGRVLRAIGFAAAPGVFRVFGILPLLGLLTWVVVTVWTLLAVVIAVREALDYRSTTRATVVCLVGFLAALVLTAIVLMPLALFAPS
jgi:hypothetical protein